MQVHLLILGAAGTAADGHITQVCPHQSGFEIVSGPPAYSRYPANGRPRRRRDRIPARAPDVEPECSPVYRNRDWSAGPATFGIPAPERVPACRRIQWSRHFALAEEASSPYGATDRGRSPCPNQASHGSIRYASATRVRSNAPGRCSNCLKQRPIRLRENPPCHYLPYIRQYRTSIGAELFQSVFGCSGEGAAGLVSEITSG